LFLPLTGWKALLAAAAGAVLLLAGMTVRGELFLALPWIVLSRVDTKSIRTFVLSGLVRSIAPGLTLSKRLVRPASPMDLTAVGSLDQAALR
jgi:hypothetical protein